MVQEKVVAALKRFSTCDISDGLLKLGFAHGGLLPDIVQRTLPKHDQEMPIVGHAWTVEFVEKSSERKADFEGHYIDQVPTSLTKHVEVEERIAVIPVLGAPENLTNAVFGGIMALRASILGAPAVVVSGRIRDIAEMNAIDSTAIFSRGLSTIGAGAFAKPVSCGTTCHVAGYGDVTTGEMIVIDENGIVVIPQSVSIELLLDLMQVLTSQDEKVKESVKSGMSVQEAFGKWRTL